MDIDQKQIFKCEINKNSKNSKNSKNNNNFL